jgi:hypothetical protein
MKSILTSLSIACLGITFSYTQANVQIIHNCPTAAASSVDVYLYDGMMWGASPAVSALLFQDATGFISLPSGTSSLRVGIAPTDGTPTLSDTLVSFAVPTLTSGQNYIAMAAGEIGNPTTPFNIFFGAGQQTSAVPTNFDFTVFHGSTTAPGVSAFLTDAVNPAINNLSYGNFTPYTAVPEADYNLLLTLGSNKNTMVDGFQVPLATLNAAGAAGVVFASGFLSPMMGQPSFGLFVALPDGTVLPLPQINLSRIQIVHNSPDPLVATVDLYVVNSTGDITPIDDVDYKTATPYLILPSDDYRILFSPSNSTDTTTALVKIPFTLEQNRSYVATAYGLANTAGTLFDNAEAVNGSAVAFTVDLYNSARLQSDVAANTDLLVFHHSPDAPQVDVVAASNSSVIIDGFDYSERVGYAPFPSVGTEVLHITPGIDNTNILASFQVPFSGLSDLAVNVYASGFLTPNDENLAGLQNFGLFAVLPTGGAFIPLTNVTSVEETENNLQAVIYPNPAIEVIQASIELQNDEVFNVQIIDLQGKVVMSQQDLNLVQGNNLVTFNVASLTQGIYQLAFSNANTYSVFKFVK